MKINFKNNKPIIVVCGLLALCLVALCIWPSSNKVYVKAARELTDLTSNIRKHFQHRPDFWGLNTQMVLDKKLYPHTMLQNGVLLSALDSQVLIGRGKEAEIIMPTAKSFDIVYKNLTKKQCEGLLLAEYEQKFWLGISDLSIITKQRETKFSWTDDKYKLPPTKAIVKKFCDDEATVIWHNE